MGFLAGKTAIITGAGYAKLSNGRCGSIGYGIATAYAKEGANLVITGRNVKKLTDAKEELERLYGVKVVCVQAELILHRRAKRFLLFRLSGDDVRRQQRQKDPHAPRNRSEVRRDNFPAVNIMNPQPVFAHVFRRDAFMIDGHALPNQQRRHQHRRHSQQPLKHDAHRAFALCLHSAFLPLCRARSTPGTLLAPL
jgi:hypothetical protein